MLVGTDALLLDAARSGDAAAFGDLVEPHRRGLVAHCYRMSGSLAEAEDLSQEALLRAWRGLGGFEQRSSFKNWLYRIATHATLDVLKRDRARLLPTETHPAADPRAPLAPPEDLWLEPFPDAMLPDEQPSAETALSQKQAVSLAFMRAVQRLPATQRAALLLKEVVGLSAAEIAEMLETTVPATNSLIQRARETLDKAPPVEPSASPAVEATLARYLAAWESADMDALSAVLGEDARLSMPPVPSWFAGRDAIGAFLREIVRTHGAFSAVVTASNGQPAVALIAHRDPREGEVGREGLTLSGVHVLSVRGGVCEEIVAFMEPHTLRAFEGTLDRARR